ncbi:Uncharacterized protein SCF082_LOCUS47539 [Durusdinium trenchii]|uniref:Uncharacterized protein n=1 Tax=Durusdinium trenchii TaxID=1381693 RepID=A0ABP0RNJ6_9DINO
MSGLSGGLVPLGSGGGSRGNARTGGSGMSSGLIPIDGGAGNSSSQRKGKSSGFSYGFEDEDNSMGSGRDGADDWMAPTPDEREDSFGFTTGRESSAVVDLDDDWDDGMDEIEMKVNEKVDQGTDLFEPALEVHDGVKKRSEANLAALDELFEDDHIIPKAAPKLPPKPSAVASKLGQSASPSTPSRSPKTVKRASSQVAPQNPGSKETIQEVQVEEENIDDAEKDDDDEVDEEFEDDIFDSLLPDETDNKKTTSILRETPSPKLSDQEPEPKTRRDVVEEEKEPEEPAIQFSFEASALAAQQQKPRRRRQIGSSEPSLRTVAKNTKPLWFSDSSDDDLPISKVDRFGAAVTRKKKTSPAPSPDAEASILRASPPTSPKSSSSPRVQKLVRSPSSSNEVPPLKQPERVSSGAAPASIDSIEFQQILGKVKQVYQDGLQQLKLELGEQQANVQASERAQWEEERQAWKLQRAELQGRLTVVEQSLEAERLTKAQLETELKGTKIEYDTKVAALQKAHEHSLAQLQQDSARARDIDKIAERVTASAQELTSLQASLQQRHDSDEAARTAQLECRERLVTEMEASARAQLERASEESRKVQSLHRAIEQSQHVVTQQVEEDRARLREEHARLEALQLTLKIEAESLRADAMQERARVREERSALESERREWAMLSSQAEARMESERHMLDKMKQAHDLERRSSLQELESTLARIREDEQQLRASRDAQAKTRRTLEEQAAKIASEKEELATQRRLLEEQAIKIHQERDRAEKLFSEAKQADSRNAEAKRLHDETQHERAVIQKEQEALERAKRQLFDEQCKYNDLRLQIAKERSQVYKHKSEAMREASEARSMQRRYALQGALDENQNFNCL